jgi:transcriptional regulator with XRE-family HTH domain
MKVFINDIEYTPTLTSLPISKSLGEHLREARKALKMSLEDASGMIGCGKGTLWELEADKTMPKLDMAAKIARAYGMSLSLMGAYAMARKGESNVPNNA